LHKAMPERDRTRIFDGSYSLAVRSDLLGML
jgi:hypothetical protein